MSRLRTLTSKLLALFGSRHRDDELSEEIRSHVDALTAANAARGLPPDAAYAAARRDFGGVEQIREAYREQRGFAFIDGLSRDIVYALRQLRSNPAFAAVAICSIALGIAATTTAFAFLDALVLNPIPYPGADRMFTITVYTEKGESRGGVALNGREFAELQKLDVLDGVVATAIWDMTMAGDRPVHVRAGQFSGNAFEYYGVRMVRGRPFTTADAPPTGEPQPVVVLSYRFWQQHFGGDGGVIGRTIRLDGEPFTIVGIAPARFRQMDVDLYMPLRRPTDSKSYYGIEARIRDGVPIERDPAFERMLVAPRVEAALQPFVLRLMNETPRRFPPDVRRVRLMSSVAARADFYRGTFTMLLVATAALLAVGCGNVSILLLARAANRRHEMAVRAAIGASRRRLASQLLVESLLLACIGGGLGILLAWRGVPAILEWLPHSYLPHDVAIEVDGVILGLTTFVAMVTGVCFGLLPALHVSKTDLRQFMQSGVLAATSPRSKRAHHVLIAAQVALSVVLLAGAGTALSAYRELTRTTLNFDSERVLLATVPLIEGSYTNWKNRTAFFNRVRERAASIPGVEYAALSFGFVCCAGPATPPLQPMLLASRPPTAGIQPATVHRVTPDLFATLNIPLRSGRIWTEAEHGRAAPVAVIAQLAAQQLWPGQDPVGQRVRLPQLRARQSWEASAPGSDGWLEVIGVVADVPTTGLRQPSRWPVLYVPFTLNMGDVAKVIIRTRGEPLAAVEALRDQIQSIDPNQPVSTTETASDVLRATGWGREEVVAAVLLVIAGVGLLLANIGLYSVVSYIAAQRAREFGIRRALGAPIAGLIWRAIRSAMTAVGVGAGVGLTLAMTVDRTTSLLTQLKTRDPMILTAAISVLVVVAMTASLIPAWRTSHANPLVALRCE
jgi:predicted permease